MSMLNDNDDLDDALAKIDGVANALNFLAAKLLQAGQVDEAAGNGLSRLLACLRNDLSYALDLLDEPIKKLKGVGA